MSSGMGQAILPIAGAIVGGVATMSPAGAMAGYSIGSGLSGAMGGQGGTLPGASSNPQSLVTGPGFGDFTTHPDSLDKTWASPQVDAQMTNVGNAAQTASAPGAASKAPSGAGSMGMGDYASLASMGMQAVAAASKAKRDQELTDAAIWKAKNPLAGTVVQGPNPQNVATNMGGFPTVGGGFVKY
jgi:hypothetical protein